MCIILLLNASGIRVETTEYVFDQVRIDEIAYVSRLELHNVSLNTHTKFQCSVRKELDSEKKSISFTIKGIYDESLQNMIT
jgi:hypothetical protein